MPQPVLALEVDASEIKAAVVEASFRDSRVLGLYREPIVADGSSIAEQLQRFLVKHSLPTQATVLSALPGDVVTWRRIWLPFRDRKRLEQTVPFELEAQVPFGLDEVVIDYHVVARDKAGSSVLAALVPREELQLHLHILEEAGLDPKVVDVAPLASVNALELSEKERPANFIFIAGNERRVTVALFREKVLTGLRTVIVESVPSQESMESTSAMESTDHTDHMDHADDVDSMAAEVRRVAAEVRWTLMALNDGAIAARMPCLLWGDGPLFAALGAALTASLGVEIRPFEDGPTRRVPQPWHQQVGAFATPLGLAMREVHPADSLGLNFRRGEFSYHRTQEEFRAALWRTAALAAVVLAMIFGSTYAEQQRLSARVAAVRAETGKVLVATLPETRPGADPVAQLRAIIDSDQKKLAMLGDVVPVDGATAVDALRELAVAVPADLRVDVDEFTMDTGEIRIRATSDSFETVDAIKQRIEERKYFGAVEVRNVKSNRDGGVGFMLLLALGRVGGL